ncbi:MAG: glycosyl hydrolase family 30, partial [Clostridia bacterium]|nr:glycosyl hydrolase family 30 [Clostridia bacterium]
MTGRIFETDFEKGIKLEQVGQFCFEENTRESERIIIFPEFTYQTWLGFGGAFTESSGYTLSKMSDKNKEEM